MLGSRATHQRRLSRLIAEVPQSGSRTLVGGLKDAGGGFGPEERVGVVPVSGDVAVHRVWRSTTEEEAAAAEPAPSECDKKAATAGHEVGVERR